MCARKTEVNNPAPTASPSFGPAGPKPIAGPPSLLTRLELARASQLTMLRLQLALHKSNRRTAMQALDDLLDIDAELEGLAARLNGGSPAHLADEAALSDFIKLQKAAIAVEKHALAGGDLRSDASSIARPPAPAVDAGPTVLPLPVDAAEEADLPVQPQLADEPVEDEDKPGRRRWIYGVVAAIVVALAALAVTAYLWPDLSVKIAHLGVFG